MSMKKNEVLALFDGLSENLLAALTDSEAIKRQVQTLVEENTRLRLENQKLQGIIAALEKPQELKGSDYAGREHLESIYDEGFHVCNDFYGQSRDNREDCAFCMALLYREQ